MQFTVSTADELPIYRQLMRQIVEAIAGGSLRPNDRLPSHRNLSEDLVIAPLTVKKAYDELELLGYLQTQRGRGTFVSRTLPKVNRAQQRDSLRQAVRALLSQAYLAGMEFPDVIRLLELADGEMRGEVIQKEKV